MSGDWRQAAFEHSAEDRALKGTSDNWPLSVGIASADAQTAPAAPAGRPGGVQLIAQLQLSDEVARYLRATSSPATRLAYEGDLRDLERWGAAVPCAPAVLAQYAAERARIHKPSTIARRIVGIGQAHELRGMPDPSKAELVRAVLRGIRRAHGVAQRQAQPFLVEDLLRVLPLIDANLRGVRDRALLLLGFASAMRRSELVAIDVEDLTFVPQGMTVNVRWGKTDQEGLGRVVAIPHGSIATACPVRAVQDWIRAGGIQRGALFRRVEKARDVEQERLSAQTVSPVVKHYAACLGLDRNLYSGHSLRSGLVTSASQLGVAGSSIRRQTGHRSESMMNRYVRDGRLFEGNAVGGLL